MELLQGAAVIPVLRIFDVAKAKAFYADYLGFKVDWEHRFEPELPLYMQISRGSVVLHLSEHHGDGSPGIVVFVRMTNLAAYHAEISAKGYRHLRPGIEARDWGRELCLTDPFGNRLRLTEQKGTV
jgi:predicted enzyme related to lactoylglutathione lyase